MRQRSKPYPLLVVIAVGVLLLVCLMIPVLVERAKKGEGNEGSQASLDVVRPSDYRLGRSEKEGGLNARRYEGESRRRLFAYLEERGQSRWTEDYHSLSVGGHGGDNTEIDERANSPESLAGNHNEYDGSTVGRISMGTSGDRELFEARLASEAIDESWTRETEKAVSEIIKDAEVGARLEEVTCAKTICRAEILFYDVASSMTMKDFAEDPIADVKLYPSFEGGKLRVYAFSGRPGRRLE